MEKKEVYSNMPQNNISQRFMNIARNPNRVVQRPNRNVINYASLVRRLNAIQIPQTIPTRRRRNTNNNNMMPKTPPKRNTKTTKKRNKKNNKK